MATTQSVRPPMLPLTDSESTELWAESNLAYMLSYLLGSCDNRFVTQWKNTAPTPIGKAVIRCSTSSGSEQVERGDQGRCRVILNTSHWRARMYAYLLNQRSSHTAHTYPPHCILLHANRTLMNARCAFLERFLYLNLRADVAYPLSTTVLVHIFKQTTFF